MADPVLLQQAGLNVLARVHAHHHAGPAPECAQERASDGDVAIRSLFAEFDPEAQIATLTLAIGMLHGYAHHLADVTCRSFGQYMLDLASTMVKITTVAD